MDYLHTYEILTYQFGMIFFHNIVIDHSLEKVQSAFLIRKFRGYDYASFRS